MVVSLLWVSPWSLIRSFLYIAQKHISQCVCGLYTLHKTSSDLRPSIQVRKNSPQIIEETSRRTTKEGSLSQDTHMRNRCHMCRTDHQNDRIFSSQSNICSPRTVDYAINVKKVDPGGRLTSLMYRQVAPNAYDLPSPPGRGEATQRKSTRSESVYKILMTETERETERSLRGRRRR